MKKIILLLLSLYTSLGFAQKKGVDMGEYKSIKTTLMQGWGQYNTQNILSYVLLPEGFELQVDLKIASGRIVQTYMGNVIEFNRSGSVPSIRPIACNLDDYYSNVELTWNGLRATIEAASVGNDLVLLISPMTPDSIRATLYVSTGLLWNKPGKLSKQDQVIRGEFAKKQVQVFAATTPSFDYNAPRNTPYFAFQCTTEQAVTTGKPRSLAEIKQIIARKRTAYQQQSNRFGPELATTYQGFMAGLHFNTIYEPIKDRIICGAARSQNVIRGGYVLFGWDPAFQGYIFSLMDQKSRAYATILEGLSERTEAGFIPNLSQGSGRKSWDRSQPPVISMLVYELYKKYNEKWFLQAVFDDLLGWNRWWIQHRLDDGLLCWGSDSAQNPFGDPAVNTLQGAALESGMDDAPMYLNDNIGFNKKTNLMALHDVGLNSLYIADCEALTNMAQQLGRTREAAELTERASTFRKQIQRLWSEKDGLFLNRRTDNGQFSTRLSPTLFYPLIARVASPQQAERMIRDHFNNPEEFALEYPLPSVSKNDPLFYKQAYWRGAIWAPLNFLVYWGLRHYDFPAERKRLAQASQRMFDNQWSTKGLISENYSSITGTGDNPSLTSIRFYAWGVLMGALQVMEKTRPMTK